MTVIEVVVGEWAGHAACRGQDPEKFFPGRGDHTSIRQAKIICHRCPVKAECLEYALDNDEPGVWGATTGQERNRMRRPPRAPGGQVAADILHHLRTHGPIDDPTGHATALLRHAMQYSGQIQWFTACLQRLEAAGLVERSCRSTARCHRIEAL